MGANEYKLSRNLSKGQVLYVGGTLKKNKYGIQIMADFIDELDENLNKKEEIVLACM